MIYLYLLIPALVIFLLGIRIIRPTQRGLVERSGKYRNYAKPGFSWIIPLVERMYIVNITDQMVNAESQEIITNDNLSVSYPEKKYENGDSSGYGVGKHNRGDGRYSVRKKSCIV